MYFINRKLIFNYEKFNILVEKFVFITQHMKSKEPRREAMESDFDLLLDFHIQQLYLNKMDMSSTSQDLVVANPVYFKRKNGND